MAGTIEDYALVGDMQSAVLVNALDLIGRRDEASELCERLLALRNDVGLLSQEYDPRYRRQVGNTPQAFSHVPPIRAALNLDAHSPGHCRRPAGRPACPAGRGHRSVLGVESPADWAEWPGLPVAGKCAMRWRGTVRLMARLRNTMTPEQLITLRYEEMIRQPVTAAQAVSAFIGAEVSSLELQQARTRRPSRAPGGASSARPRRPRWRGSRGTSCAGLVTGIPPDRCRPRPQ